MQTLSGEKMENRRQPEMTKKLNRPKADKKAGFLRRLV
jgi:hypothetical protein